MSDPMPSARRRHAPATLRNREPILAVLRRHLPASGTVLEIASGTGEHAAYFAAELGRAPDWQTSDREAEALASIAAWGDAAGLPPPLSIDVARPGWHQALAARPVVAIVCINMIHIAPWRACEGLMAGSGALLPEGAPLYLYGPYREGGRHTAPSNEAFDRLLRSENPGWGVRDLESVLELAGRHGLDLAERVEMPSNNLSVVLKRRPRPA